MKRAGSDDPAPTLAPAIVCATALWVIGIAAAHYEPVKRPAGEAWVVTASEKNPYHPTLVRAHVRFSTATLAP